MTDESKGAFFNDPEVKARALEEMRAADDYRWRIDPAIPGRWGLPAPLVTLIGCVAQGMAAEGAPLAGSDILSSIGPGSDVASVVPLFLAWAMAPAPEGAGILVSLSFDEAAVIERAVALCRKRAAGERVDPRDWGRLARAANRASDVESKGAADAVGSDARAAALLDAAAAAASSSVVRYACRVDDEKAHTPLPPVWHFWKILWCVARLRARSSPGDASRIPLAAMSYEKLLGLLGAPVPEPTGPSFRDRCGAILSPE